VLEYRAKTTTKNLTSPILLELIVYVGITVRIKPVFNGDSGNVRLPPHLPLPLETDAFACTWIYQKYRDPGLHAASACVSVLGVDVRGRGYPLGIRSILNNRNLIMGSNYFANVCSSVLGLFLSIDVLYYVMFHVLCGLEEE
jgi:hypothetical protein